MGSGQERSDELSRRAFWKSTYNSGDTHVRNIAALNSSTGSKFVDTSSLATRFGRCSADDEVLRLIQVDFPLFIGAICAIVAWLSISFGKMNRIERRFLVSWAVAFEIVFCLVFSFGIIGYM